MRPFPIALLAVLAGTAAPGLAQLGAPPVPSENPITEPKRILGKILFWDEQLSSTNTMACGTCHISGQGGSDPRFGPGATHPGLDGLLGTADDKSASPGVRRANARDDYQPDPVFGFEPQVTRRRAPSHIAATFFDSLFWDGRAASAFVDPQAGLISIPGGGALESQAVGPIVSSIEMAHAGRTWGQVADKLAASRPLALGWNLPADVAGRLASDPSYPDLFADAFGDPAITAERIAYAIATYERTLVPDQSPWDLWIAGDPSALTAQQLQGMADFESAAARCDQCHPAPLFSDGTFRNIGLRPIAEDEGLQAITGQLADRGKFKVPSLRNVSLRGSWFHNGDPSITTLVDTVAIYHNGGGPFSENRDPVLVGLTVSGPMRVSIAAFMEALTDPRVAAEQFPFDRPSLHSERPYPNPVFAGGGVAGSGGLTPELIAETPPNLGNADFKIGVSGALGGALSFPEATVGGQPLAGPRPARGGLPWRLMRLQGTGPGQGYGTLQVGVPQDLAFAGVQVAVRWIVIDPGAPLGRAVSPTATYTAF